MTEIPGLTVTERGFLKYADFTDMYGSRVWVQESSNIRGGVWIFCDSDTIPKPSPHLNKAMARAIRDSLTHYIENGYDEIED